MLRWVRFLLSFVFFCSISWLATAPGANAAVLYFWGPMTINHFSSGLSEEVYLNGSLEYELTTSGMTPETTGDPIPGYLMTVSFTAGWLQVEQTGIGVIWVTDDHPDRNDAVYFSLEDIVLNTYTQIHFLGANQQWLDSAAIRSEWPHENLTEMRFSWHDNRGEPYDTSAFHTNFSSSPPFVVPEPSSLALVGAGLVLSVCWRRRRSGRS